MNAKDWKEGDTLRRKTPYHPGKRSAPHGELCRIKKIITGVGSNDETIFLVVGNRTTGNPLSRVEKYYEWVSREGAV